MTFYDEVVGRYSNERVSTNRNGEPTLKEAFFAVCEKYEATRKMKQRYMAKFRYAAFCAWPGITPICFSMPMRS